MPLRLGFLRGRRRSPLSSPTRAVRYEPMDVATDLRIGTELLGYRLDERIARGGMGVVYRAWDPRLKRNVALKLLAPELASDERFRNRFLAETELAAALEHPSVVPIHDAGEIDGQLYLVMRFVEGTDLKRLLRDEGTLEPEKAVEVCSKVAAALDAAHEHGLVHRDVKPSNVLIDRHGHVYLADFGLSRRLVDRARGHAAEVSLGTPAYVAPEEIEGREVDGRTDQYSLACVLVECLTAHAPFPRTSEAATLFAHLEEEPPRLHGLEHVLGRALAKQPDARYDSCGEFVEAARSALGLAAPRRSPWPVVAALGTLALATVLLATVLFRGSEDSLTIAGSLTRIDIHDGRVLDSYRLEFVPRAIAVDEEGIWLADHQSSRIARLDLRGNVQVGTVAHGTPTDLSLAGSRVVVANGPLDGTVDVLDRATAASEALVRLGSDDRSGAPVHVATDGDAVWVATGDRRVGRLDAARKRLVAPVELPPPANERADASFSAISVGEGRIWVVGDALDSKLWRIDPSTSAVATVRLPFVPTDVAAGENAVWVTTQLEDRLARIDPRSLRVTDVVRVGRGASAVAVAGGFVWVANTIDGTVSRVDAETLEAETVDVDGTPRDIVAGDTIWVSGSVAPESTPEEAVTVGILADCEGRQGFFYEDSLAGAEVALLRRGGELRGTKSTEGVEGTTVAGREVLLRLGCGDGTAPRALAEARRLVELVGADVLVGPSTVAEALAVKEYARLRPAVTFVNGLSTGQELMLGARPAPNLFNFATDGAQWMAGVGDHAYTTLGWRRVVTLAEEFPFAYTQNAGFVAEFCALGGTIVKTIWVPRGTTDLAPYAARVPRRGVDGFVLLGEAPVLLAYVDSLAQLREGRLADRVVAGANLYVPQVAEGLGPRIAGIAAGVQDPGPGMSQEPAWLGYNEDFDRAFPALAGGASGPWSLSYFNAMSALLQALEASGSDVSDGGRRLQATLAATVLHAPQGRIRLDERHQAIGPNYITPYKLNKRGELDGYKILRRIDAVEQTFNGYFKPGSPPPGKNVPCMRADPPPWTR
jgi:branched-chain amino acid transport system substrate-binding protein